jgi:DNA repair exonuclease SbcCD ATPase subunit
MKWTKLYIKNFLSIEEAELSLDKRGLVLIEGRNKTNEAFHSNGSGKSSLVGDSISYGLYDITTKGLKADDVINNVTKKNTAVILEGERAGNTYRIERYRKHTKHKNKVLLFINGEDVTEASTKKTNEEIEKIIGIDYNTFINSIMFSQGSGAGRFATATDKEKKEILENLVNLNMYATAQDVAKERVRAKQEEINENIRGAERLNWELSNVDMMEQQDQENYEKTRTMIQQEHQSMESTVAEMSEFTSSNLAPIEQVREEIEELKQQQSEALGIDITEDTNKINELYRDLQDKINEQSRLEGKKSDLVQKYKQLQEDTHCPVCGNELDQKHRERERVSIREQLREIFIELQPLQGQIESLTADYNHAHAEYEERKSTHDRLKNEYRSIVQNVQQKENQIRTYEQTLRDYKTKIENIESTLKKLNNVPQPRSRKSDRDNINKKIKAQKDGLLALEKDKTKLEDVVKVYSNSGVKSHVLDLITPFLNKRANRYLNMLSGSDIEITFSTQTRNKNGELSDKFDVQAVNNAGGSTYQANSEGEKKRIDLAISLAIQDLVMSKTDLSTNFVVYDEVFDALDSVGSENVVTLLRERLGTVGSIFVITHNEHLKPLFENVITVTKVKKGLSTVTEGVESS